MTFQVLHSSIRVVVCLGAVIACAGTALAEEAASPAAGVVFPEYDTLANGPQQLRPLPGQHAVVFSMYGAPGELEKLRQLVAVMREQKLGNGLDPGPSPQPDATPVFDYLATVGWPVVCYPGGDMQIKGGRGPLGRDNEASLAAMDQAGVFTAVQLGEWGYYFHNLSCNEPWWRDNFGKDFDEYKQLMKPSGLAGYDRRPVSKQECYDVVKDYFTSKSRDLLGRVISVTGHSHYEAYAGEWGARCIGLELGENIAFTQSKMAFARGASKAWQKPWSVQVSPWMSGAVTCSGPLRTEGGGARGLDAGHSLSFYERMWLHAWFAGAALVTPENSIATFFDKPEAPWKLTSHGQKAAEVFKFMQSHNRGVPYTPVAVVLDHLAGYNGYMDKPWGILDPTPGDREVRDLFDNQLFPGSDHIHVKPDPENPEGSYLRATPYGESFDVLLTSVPPEVLSTYPVILLAGDITFDDAFLGELEKALRRGSRVLMSGRHEYALGEGFDRVAAQGNVEVLDPWANPATGRSTVISNERLEQLSREVLPIAVEGDPVQYQINRLPGGWVIELVNNRGVAKKKDQPAVIDTTAVARVTLKPRITCGAIKERRSGRVHPATDPVTVEIGPGATEFVEFLSQVPDDEGFVSLFNGKDLTGWNGDDWAVEDGVMVCHGKPLTCTRGEYANFVLRFEVKMSPGGNNGVNIRSDGSVWNEIQILDDIHPVFDKTIHPYQAHGSIYGVVPAKRGFLKPAGQWNTEEIVANGSRITVTLNGTVIIDADLSTIDLDKCIDGSAHPGWRRTSGVIGFLGHRNCYEEEGPVYFRNVRIKKLP